VVTLRPGSYELLVSSDGRTWRTIAIVSGRSGTTDVLRFRARGVRFVQVRITSGTSSGSTLPELDELVVG
jgi:hypothetical protein